MPEDRDAGWTVSIKDIEGLAKDFDAHTNALEPRSREAWEAKDRFDQRVRVIYEQRVASKYPSLTLEDFKAKIRTECRKFLSKEFEKKRRKR
jgi:hypothetical protein